MYNPKIPLSRKEAENRKVHHILGVLVQSPEVRETGKPTNTTFHKTNIQLGGASQPLTSTIIKCTYLDTINKVVKVNTVNLSVLH